MHVAPMRSCDEEALRDLSVRDLLVRDLLVRDLYETCRCETCRLSIRRDSSSEGSSATERRRGAKRGEERRRGAKRGAWQGARPKGKASSSTSRAKEKQHGNKWSAEQWPHACSARAGRDAGRRAAALTVADRRHAAANPNAHTATAASSASAGSCRWPARRRIRRRPVMREIRTADHHSFRRGRTARRVLQKS